MKYITLETPQGARVPIIFPDALTHLYVAGAMQLVIDTLDPAKDLRPQQLERMLRDGKAPVRSAGFIMVPDAHVNGMSESLGGIAHNPADVARIVLGDAVQFMDDETALFLYARLRSMSEQRT